MRLAVLSSLFILGLAAQPLAAQGGPPPGMGGGAMQAQAREMQFKGITLTDAQKAKLDSLDTAQRALAPELMGMEPAQRRERMQAERAKRTDAIKAMLTAEQFAQYEKNLEEMRAQMGGRRGPPPRR